ETCADDCAVGFEHELAERARAAGCRVTREGMRGLSRYDERAVAWRAREPSPPKPQLHHVTVDAHPLRLDAGWNRVVGECRAHLDAHIWPPLVKRDNGVERGRVIPGVVTAAARATAGRIGKEAVDVN